MINALKAKFFGGSFLLFADIQAAFDTAKSEVVHALLSRMYPNSVTPAKIALLNKGNTGEISINGQLSKPVKLKQGTGQGGPASTVKFTVLHSFWIAVIQFAIKSANLP